MTRHQLSVKLLNIEDKLERLVQRVENEGISFVGVDALGEEMSLEKHAQIMRSNISGVVRKVRALVACTK